MKQIGLALGRARRGVGWRRSWPLGTGGGLRHMARAALFLTLAVSVALPFGPVASPAAQYLSSVDHTHPTGIPYGTEVPISDAYGKQQALRYGGATVVSRMLHRITAKTSPARGAHDLDVQSGIWAGYIADTVSSPDWVNGSTGYFYAEQVCGGCSEIASWVGVGGVEGPAPSHLAQAGIDQRAMQVVYEIYPNPVNYVGLHVTQGDHMYADVHLDYNNYLWYMLVEDLSSGQYWNSEFSFNPDENSAEWIVEDVNSAAVPYFPTITWTNAIWIDGYGAYLPMDSNNAILQRDYVQASCGTIYASAYWSDENFNVTPNYC